MDRHSPADYHQQLWQLMPQGLAWSRKPDGAGDRLLAGMADELARIDARAINLCLEEFYAISARELLPEWEAEYGLPDACRTLGETLDQRIEDLLQKIRAIGGQSIGYFLGLLRALGIDGVTIEEFRPFRAGMSSAGDPLYSAEWQFVFALLIPTERMWRFRAGRNAAGDPLQYWKTNEFIECIVNRLKPAHTYAMFGYYTGDAFHYYDQDGNIVLRSEIEDDGTNPIFRLDEDGNVAVRENIPSGAETTAHRMDGDGNIETRPMEE
jgi:uncharacterized protein YmfQ (DUF2313 family)